MPKSLRTGARSLDEWIGDVAGDLINQLSALMAELRPTQLRAGDDDDDADARDDDERNTLGDEELLEFLFSRGLLPSYAFPTDLTSFLVDA